MTTNKLLKKLIETLDNVDEFTDHSEEPIKSDLKNQLLNNRPALIEQLADIINNIVDWNDDDERRHALEIADKYSSLPIIEYQLNIINDLI